MKLSLVKKIFRNTSGLSILEVVLAAGIFIIFSSGAVISLIQAFNANRLGLEFTIASKYASEGLEAVRSIKNQNYAGLTNTTQTGVAIVGGTWTFSGVGSTISVGKPYQRVITIEDARRDGVPPAGNIVASGGTVDTATKKITSTVNWNFTTARPESISFVTYLTNWRKTIVPQRGGMLVFANGNGTTDAIAYRILNANGTWGSVTAMPDFDTSATNKVPQVIRAFASSTRNEKIVLSRHSNPTQQFIYAHVFNGTSWTSWQFSARNSIAFDTSNPGVKNFDGTYLNNGNFLAVYSDGTTSPKYRTWNGTSWSPNPPTAGTTTANVGGVPSNISIRNRPGTNTAMLVVFDQLSDTNTTLYNGSTWSGVTEHASNAPANNREFAEFAWSSHTTTKGALIFQTTSSDTRMNLKIWNGSTWQGGTNTNADAQGRLGPMELDGGRLGAEEYLACDKDIDNDIYCFRANGSVSWSTPINNEITLSTDTGTHRSFDLAYETVNGAEAIVVYADTTNPSAQARLKKYNAATNSFDTSPIVLDPLGAAVKTVKLRTTSVNDEIMIMMTDANKALYTTVWDGDENQVYTAVGGKGLTTHGTLGTSVTEFWYGFAWDAF